MDSERDAQKHRREQGEPHGRVLMDRYVNLEAARDDRGTVRTATALAGRRSADIESAKNSGQYRR